MTVMIYANTEKAAVRPVFSQTIEFLKAHDITYYVTDEIACTYGCQEQMIQPQDWSKITLAITLGGDGTLLRAARKNAIRNIPVCGINMGRLGFLTEVEIPDLLTSLELLLKRHYFIEERLMLDAYLKDEEEETWLGTALNDVVVSKGPYAKLLRAKVSINGQLTARYAADGMIVATPTGSTGYALSAGGPIIHPRLPVIEVTPICPHTLQWRPLIIGQDEEVKIQLEERGDESLLTLDGQDICNLTGQKHVLIRRSPYSAKFIRFHHNRYYSNLKQKFNRGEENESS